MGNVIDQMGAMSGRLCEMPHGYQKLNGFGCPVENGIGNIRGLVSFAKSAVVVGVHHGCCVHHGLGWICNLKFCVCRSKLSWKQVLLTSFVVSWQQKTNFDLLTSFTF